MQGRVMRMYSMKQLTAAMTLTLALLPAVSFGKTIDVIASEFAFEPETISVEKGETVTLVFKNTGALSHNLHIPGQDVQVETIQTGDTTRHRFTPDERGVFSFHCAVPGHKEAGMTGALEVH